MGPKLVDYLTYEPEESGILWIRFNRPDRLNALMGSAEENGTVAKVGEYSAPAMTIPTSASSFSPASGGSSVPARI